MFWDWAHKTQKLTAKFTVEYIDNKSDFNRLARHDAPWTFGRWRS